MTDNKYSMFHALHQQDDPLILFNIWDAATAKAVSENGGKAIATGSWSLAAAQGYPDGEAIPFALVIDIVKNIVHSVDIPVTVDFECGYSDNLEELSDNFQKLLDAGVVGINFEDQILGENKLQPVSGYVGKLDVLANRAAKFDNDIFINARTDLFLQEENSAVHTDLIGDALTRQKHYADAGASGFFVPGLSNPELIKRLCKEASLPVNIMANAVDADIDALKQLGAARISFGPFPFIDHINAFGKGISRIYA